MTTATDTDVSTAKYCSSSEHHYSQLMSTDCVAVYCIKCGHLIRYDIANTLAASEHQEAD